MFDKFIHTSYITVVKKLERNRLKFDVILSIILSKSLKFYREFGVLKHVDLELHEHLTFWSHNLHIVFSCHLESNCDDLGEIPCRFDKVVKNIDKTAKASVHKIKELY